MLKVEKPGPFSNQLHIYVDDDGFRDIPVRVHGMAHAVELQ